MLSRFNLYIQKDELFGKLVKNASYLLSAGLISNVIAFVQTIIVARYLGVTNYGLMVLVFSYVTIVNQFFDFRVWELITKYGAEYRAKGEEGKCLATIKLGYGIDICSSIAAVFVTVLMAKIVATVIFHKPETAEVAAIYAFSLLVVNISNSSSAVLRVFDRFSWVGAQNIGRSCLGISLVLIAILLKWDLRGIIYAHLVTALISGIIFILLAYVTIRKFLIVNGKEGSISVLRGRLKEKSKFLFYTNMTGFLTMFLDNFDNFVLGYFHGPACVGYYKMGKNFATVFVRLSDPVMNAIYPQLSGLWATARKKEIRRLVLKVSKTMAVFAGAVIVLTTVFAPQIISLTVGAKYLDSVVPMRIIVWMMLWVILVWAGVLLQSAGRPDLFFKAKACATVTSLIGWLTLVPTYGYIGSAIGYLIHFLAWILMIWFVFYRYKFLE